MPAETTTTKEPPPPPPPPPPANSTAAPSNPTSQRQPQPHAQTSAAPPAAAAPAPAPAQNEPASPPLPARPTAQAPGPRASRFQGVLDSTLSHTLARISWDNFAACYPTIAARAPQPLRAVQRQMVERLGALCKKEFASILQARNVVAKLNELESLVSEAELRRDEAGVAGQKELPIPPHTLPPETILAAHLAPHLAQHQSQLNARLQTTQAHNARLFADVRRQRAEVESLVALLQKVLDDVDAANAMLIDPAEGQGEGEGGNGGVGVGVADDLARETREVEGEMARVAAAAAATAAGGGGGSGGGK